MTEPFVINGLSRRRFKKIWFRLVCLYNKSEHKNAFLLGASTETITVLINWQWKKDFISEKEVKAAFQLAHEYGACEIEKLPNGYHKRVPKYLRIVFPYRNPELPLMTKANALTLCPVIQPD